MFNVFAVESIMITATPVPGDAFAGDSLGPFINTSYVIGPAKRLPAANRTPNGIHFFIVILNLQTEELSGSTGLWASNARLRLRSVDWSNLPLNGQSNKESLSNSEESQSRRMSRVRVVSSSPRKEGNMKTRMNSIRIACAAVSLFGLFVLRGKDAPSQDSATARAQTARSELIGELTKSLSITPAQASGGAGALFGLAKTRLSPADFNKVAASVPGIDKLIKSAPVSSGGGGIPGLSGIENSLVGLDSVAGSFQKLGLSPSMAGQFVPVLTNFVKAKGGSGVASLLSGALK
jgi:hypothetical protein